ncbi:hypothetical protein SDC9_199686 [bioreactor metagenome]|uniref:Uncharacterized protein n=1 Tax=bioreactor metagenome TaxID=1076179 RepID=A0A645IUF5_9ZZZZ
MAARGERPNHHPAAFAVIIADGDHIAAAVAEQFGVIGVGQPDRRVFLQLFRGRGIFLAHRDHFAAGMFSHRLQ